jgi:hypothetical protein
MHPHVSTLSVLELGNCAFALAEAEKFGFGTRSGNREQGSGFRVRNSGVPFSTVLVDNSILKSRTHENLTIKLLFMNSLYRFSSIYQSVIDLA